MSGIRAELKIQSPSVCPVAEVSRTLDAPSTSVTSAQIDSETATEEFILDIDSPPDEEAFSEVTDDLEEIFSYKTKSAFRFERSTEGCPCQDVQKFGCPLLDVYARDGALVLVFHATDVASLQEVLRELQDRWSNVTVHRLIRSGGRQSDDDLVFVDRNELTDRQKEVLETAHAMGYFDHPKGANASEVAEELGITQATFTEHLSAAQRKLLTSILET